MRLTPQMGTANAEIKDTAVEKPELKVFPFKALSRSGYIRSCSTYCQGFLRF